MRPEDRESLFWALSEISREARDASAPADDSILSDATLRAYREGRLSEDEARRVEQRLVADPISRRRLEKLAGVVPDTAPLAVRRRLLEDFGEPAGRLRPARRLSAWRRGRPAAAMVMLATSWLILRPRPVPLPAYEVQIAALTDNRDEAMASIFAEAYADSMVTIDAAAERAVEGLEVGVYRVAGKRLERVEGIVSQRPERLGAVRFEASAAQLVGREPGDHELFVVIAKRGRMPAAVALRSGVDPAVTLAAGGRRQVHRLTLRLLAERSAASIHGNAPDEEVPCSSPHSVLAAISVSSSRPSCLRSPATALLSPSLRIFPGHATKATVQTPPRRRA